MKASLAACVLLAVTAPAIAFAGDPDAGKTWASCVEHVPQGATRPQMTDSFPEVGQSGYAVALEVTVIHGKGEIVMPEGFRVTAGEASRALLEAGFAIPDPDGGAGPALTTTQGANDATTKIAIPFVPLAKLPGKVTMELPPVPISVQRASGDVVTVCTHPHPIAIDEPAGVSGKDDPPVRGNPGPRQQREEWVLAKLLTIGILIGVVIGALVGLFVRRWKRVPKETPAPPKRLPWLVALEELEALKTSTLLTEGKHDVYYDRVSDCVRKYLGARYGFDGLETTTDEMRGFLRRVRPAVPGINKIAAFLADCDLVKFAKVAPQEGDCLDAHKRGEEIVKMTVPAPASPPTEEAAAP